MTMIEPSLCFLVRIAEILTGEAFISISVHPNGSKSSSVGFATGNSFEFTECIFVMFISCSYGSCLSVLIIFFFFFFSVLAPCHNSSIAELWNKCYWHSRTYSWLSLVVQIITNKLYEVFSSLWTWSEIKIRLESLGIKWIILSCITCICSRSSSLCVDSCFISCCEKNHWIPLFSQASEAGIHHNTAG